MTENNESLLRFLGEFRKRLIYCLLTWVSIFFVLCYFANDLYFLLANPLLKLLPEGHGLIATHVVSVFLVPFELTLVVSLFIALPIFLYQLWAFVAPALYQHEKRFVWTLLFISSCLFYVGILFAYFILFPILFRFLTQSVPTGVMMSPDIGVYLNFTLKFLFIFGMIFEVPVVTIVLAWAGIVTRDQLIKARPYVIVGAFVVGMLLTPPDVVSQLFVALPLCFLYEIGIRCLPLFLRRAPIKDQEKI